MRYKYLLILLIAVFLGCKKDDSFGGSDNQWIHQQFKHYYLWSDRVSLIERTNLSLDAIPYFHSLRYNSESIYGDRYSSITNSIASKASDDHTYKTGTGIFGRIIIDNNDRFFFQILYVVLDSPAYNANLKRGDLFKKINGIDVNISNIEAELSLSTVRLTRTNLNYEQLEDVTLHATRFVNIPIIYHSNISVGSSNYGYLVYSHFYSGDNDRFKHSLRAAFRNMKMGGARDLILDLRYNGGGELDMATFLASLIAPKTTVISNEVFANLEYNQTYSKELYTKDKEYNIKRFSLTQGELDTCNINVGNMYVITTRNTASASEVVTHCLKPYINVKVVGTPSHGKNVGINTITDPSGVIPWSLQLVTTRVYDKKYSEGYEQGIYVDRNVHENYTQLGDFGSINKDPLLNGVINEILGHKSYQDQPMAKSISEITDGDKVLLVL